MTSPVSITYAELEAAFESISFGPYGESTARICRRTGRFHFQSVVFGSDDENTPEDFDDDERYLAVPHQSDLNLGRDVVFQFVKYEAPEIADPVFDAFRRKGAYAAFKSILARAGLVDRWQQFEAESKRAALTRWAQENGLLDVDGRSAGAPAAGATPP